MKKKILIITNLPTPYRVDFYNELGAHVDLTVIVEGKRSDSLQFNWNDEGKLHFNIKYFSKILDEHHIYWKIIKEVFSMVYDDIIISTYHTRTQSLLLLLFKLFNKQYYFETDGGIIKKQESKFKKYIKTKLIGGAKGYFSPSSSSDDYLVYYGATSERIYRYPFTSLNESEILGRPLSTEGKRIIRNKLGIKEQYVILGVGQFIPRKGFDVLFKACKGISNNVGIYIVGGTPTDYYLKLKDELKLDNLYFVGFKSRAEVSEYYNAADLFVLPTREDIWGLVINEAMAKGLPVVSTDNCVAAKELLPDDCIVPVDDSFSLRSIIDKILSNENYRSDLSKRSLSIIKSYTSRSMALAHFNVFK